VARSGSGITEGAVNGWPALYLTNGALAVTVLPGKGADIYEITDLATGIDPLFKAPWGLQPPGAPAREGSDGAAFLENYEGAWQELLPNTNDACTHQGRPVPFHGEVATRPWSVAVEADDGERVAVRLSVDCETVPLRLERLMTLRSGQRRLELSERVTNRSGAPVQFTWGHHCVLGPPLVAAGAVLRTPARTIITPPQAWEDTARLAPGQRSAWPLAQRRGGGEVDLSHVPGPEAASHDDVFLTGLDGGWAEVGQPALGIAFRLEWDPGVFGWIISWQPYGGARAMPLRGAYALGIEPWAAGGNLEHAVAAGEALRLDAHAHLDTRLTASFRPW
jgi:galactose mutarotase-like enzyme